MWCLEWPKAHPVCYSTMLIYKNDYKHCIIHVYVYMYIVWLGCLSHTGLVHIFIWEGDRYWRAWHNDTLPAESSVGVGPLPLIPGGQPVSQCHCVCAGLALHCTYHTPGRASFFYFTKCIYVQCTCSLYVHVYNHKQWIIIYTRDCAGYMHDHITIACCIKFSLVHMYIPRLHPQGGKGPAWQKFLGMSRNQFLLYTSV